MASLLSTQSPQFSIGERVQYVNQARQETLVGTISQVDGGRWVTFEGICSSTGDSEICSDAVKRYSLRYSEPKDRGDERRTITMTVDRILSSAGLAP